MKGLDRIEARAAVRDDIERVLERWRVVLAKVGTVKNCQTHSVSRDDP